MECFRCEQPAVQECARCGALYCDDHGDTLCERCMDPFNALPSSRVYRGSLLALLISTVFAVWLLVRPGGSDAGAPPAGLVGVLPSTTVTAVTTAAPQSPTPAPTQEAPTETPAPVATPAPTEPPPTPAPPAPQTYQVVAGDTLSIIANRFRGSVDQNTYLQRLYQANNLGPTSVLAIGQTITLP
ncbi:MAG: LysM peptidoglycan-binding domain-containing protein [Dehalococcoidia bacterium]